MARIIDILHGSSRPSTEIVNYFQEQRNKIDPNVSEMARSIANSRSHTVEIYTEALEVLKNDTSQMYDNIAIYSYTPETICDMALYNADIMMSHPTIKGAYNRGDLEGWDYQYEAAGVTHTNRNYTMWSGISVDGAKLVSETYMGGVDETPLTIEEKLALGFNLSNIIEWRKKDIDLTNASLFKRNIEL